MVLTLQAAVVEPSGKPLALWEWAISSAGAGQILVKAGACGVCHTDLRAARRNWPVKTALPFIPGDEGIGLGRRSRARRAERERRRPGQRALALPGLWSLRARPVGLENGVYRGTVRRLYPIRRDMAEAVAFASCPWMGYMSKAV